MLANTASAEVYAWNTANPATGSFDCNGGDILIVAVFGNSSMTDVTATYNGVAMTRISFISDSSAGNKNALFYLANPSSGSNTISVTRTNGASLEVVASAYSGADVASIVDDFSTDAGVNSTSFTSSAVTVSDANNWFVTAFRETDTYGAGISSSDVARRVRGSVVREALWDSNGTIGATGSQTVSYTMSTSGRLDGHTLLVLSALGTITETLTASITAAASITTKNTWAQALTASITAAATIGKGFTQALTASITAAASVSTLALQAIVLTASITADTVMTNVNTFKRTLTGSTTVASTITKTASLFRTLTASVTTAASITGVKTFYQALTAAVSAAASIANGGAIRTRIVQAYTTVQAKIHILFYKKKYTKEDEDYKRKY